MSSRRSQWIRSRRKPCSQAIVRSAGAVFDASFGDDRSDPALSHQAAVLVVVVASVGEECVGPVSGPADGAGHGRDLVQQRQQTGDVVAVSAGQRHRERDALAIGEDVVLAAAERGAGGPYGLGVTPAGPYKNGAGRAEERPCEK
jgi:hypothetical protein